MRTTPVYNQKAHRLKLISGTPEARAQTFLCLMRNRCLTLVSQTQAALATMLHIILEWSSHCLTRWIYFTLLPHVIWDGDNAKQKVKE